MTEAEWLASEDPTCMLAHLCWEEGAGVRRVTGTCPSDRKLRLFACACCRQAWHLLTDPLSRQAVEVAERVADGLAGLGEAAEARTWARAVDSAVSHSGVAPAAQAALLRDVMGNPFRPADRSTFWRIDPENCLALLPQPVLTPTTRCLALAAYLERDRPCPTCRGKGSLFSCRGKGSLYWGEGNCGVCRGSGRITDGMLDPARLAVLADALEEAGCTDPDVLGHLRGPGPHCRGCWVVDMLLGKS